MLHTGEGIGGMVIDEMLKKHSLFSFSVRHLPIE